jgi:hypothetical protein
LQARYYGWTFFLDRGIENGLIIRARYWGLEIPASEACGDTIS